MPKPVTQHEIEIVMSVDRDAGVLDLRLYAHHPKRGPPQIVGTATLRMEDLREVLPMMTERLRFEDLLVEAEAAARKSKNGKRQAPETAWFSRRCESQWHYWRAWRRMERRPLIRFCAFPYQSSFVHRPGRDVPPPRPRDNRKSGLRPLHTRPAFAILRHSPECS